MFLVLNKNFWLLWINRIFNRLAYQLVFFTLLVWVYQLTGSNSAVSLFMVMYIIASVSFSLIAGVAVDFYDRRLLIVGSNIIWGLLVLLFIPAQNNFAFILAITLVTQALDEFFNPSQGSSLPALVEDKKLLSANSLVQIAIFAASATGYFLSGILMKYLGYPAPFVLGAALVISGGLLATGLPPLRHQEKTPSLREFFQKVKSHLLEQLDFLIHERNVTSTVVLLSVVSAMATGASAVLPGFAQEVWRIDARDLSFVAILPLALGVVGATLLLMRGWGGIKVWQAVLGLGATTLIAAAGGQLDWWEISFLSFVLGIFVSFATIPVLTSLQRITPSHILGRTIGSGTLLYSFFTGIFVLTFGVVADLWGEVVPMILVGLVALLAGFWVKAKVAIK